MQSARSPTSSTNQLCQFGLTNTATYTSLINTYASVMVTNYLAQSRRKRAASMTCSTLSSLGSPAIAALTSDQLLSVSDFGNCVTLLGYSANGWSSSQLTSLVSLAKTVIFSFLNKIYNILLSIFLFKVFCNFCKYVG